MLKTNTINLVNMCNASIILKKKTNETNLIIFNKTKFISIPIKVDFFLFNNNLYQIILMTQINNFNKLWKNIFFSFFVKIKFTGKGYRIKRCKKKIIFYFNKSHIDIILTQNYILRKLKKTKIFLKSTNTLLHIIAKLIINIRYISVFTKRGLRLTRSIILKKQGKKSLKNM